MKIGVNLKIDVTKLDKSRFFKGAKGTYADLSVYLDTDQADEYGNNGSIQIAATKEEREAKQKMPYVGSARIYFQSGESKQEKPAKAAQQVKTAEPDFDDEIPF